MVAFYFLLEKHALIHSFTIHTNIESKYIAVNILSIVSLGQRQHSKVVLSYPANEVWKAINYFCLSRLAIHNLTLFPPSKTKANTSFPFLP
jgi:hypothetical protein